MVIKNYKTLTTDKHEAVLFFLTTFMALFGSFELILSKNVNATTMLNIVFCIQIVLFFIGICLLLFKKTIYLRYIVCAIFFLSTFMIIQMRVVIQYSVLFSLFVWIGIASLYGDIAFTFITSCLALTCAVYAHKLLSGMKGFEVLYSNIILLCGLLCYHNKSVVSTILNVKQKSDELIQQNESLESIFYSIRHQSNQLFNSIETLSTCTASLEEMSNNITEIISKVITNTVVVNDNIEADTSKIEIIKEKVLQVWNVYQEVIRSVVQTSKDLEINREHRKVLWDNIELAHKKTAITKKTLDKANEKVLIILNATAELNKLTNSINMIALNAGIEAARAGERGRGFMVISNEIKKLNTNCDEIVKNIEKTSTHVLTSLKEVNEVFMDLDMTIQNTYDIKDSDLTITNNLNAKMDGMHSSITSIKTEIKSLTHSTEELTDSMNHLENASRNVNEAMEKIMGTIQEQTASVEEVNTQTFDMKKRINILKDIAEK